MRTLTLREKARLAALDYHAVKEMVEDSTAFRSELRNAYTRALDTLRKADAADESQPFTGEC